MKFSVCAIDKVLDGARPFPLVADSYERCGEIAAELGFDGIELQVQNPAGYNGPALKRRLDDLGIGVSAVTTGLAYLYEGMSMVHPDAKIRQATVERLWRQLDLAKELNSQILVGFLRGRKTPGMSDEDFINLLTDSVGKVLQYAEDIKAPFVMEQINHNDGDVLCTTEQTMSFLEKFNSPWLLYNGDTYHMMTEDMNIPEAIRRSLSKLVLFHVSDAGRLLPGGPLGRPHEMDKAAPIDLSKGCEVLFDPGFNFGEAADVLHAANYDKWTSIECLPIPDSYTACKEGIAYLKKYFG